MYCVSYKLSEYNQGFNLIIQTTRNWKKKIVYCILKSLPENAVYCWFIGFFFFSSGY